LQIVTKTVKVDSAKINRLLRIYEIVEGHPTTENDVVQWAIDNSVVFAEDFYMTKIMESNEESK